LILSAFENRLRTGLATHHANKCSRWANCKLTMHIKNI